MLNVIGAAAAPGAVGCVAGGGAERAAVNMGVVVAALAKCATKAGAAEKPRARAPSTQSYLRKWNALPRSGLSLKNCEKSTATSWRPGA
jgi:hypothetical protein